MNIQDAIATLRNLNETELADHVRRAQAEGDVRIFAIEYAALNVEHVDDGGLLVHGAASSEALAAAKADLEDVIPVAAVFTPQGGCRFAAYTKMLSGRTEFLGTFEAGELDDEGQWDEGEDDVAGMADAAFPAPAGLTYCEAY